MKLENPKRTVAYLTLTFGMSWTMAFGYFALSGKTHSPSWLVMAIAFMFTPALATVAVEKLVPKNDARHRLGLSLRPNWCFLVGWLAPAGLALLSCALSLAQPGVSFVGDVESSNIFGFLKSTLPPGRVAGMKQQLATIPVHVFWLVLFGGTMAGLTVNGIAGFGEELGWRGFLQSEWQALGFWRSSWLIGVVWGLWHAPFILHGYNYPGHPVTGVFMMTLWTVLFAPLIGFVRLRSGSVFAAAIMHGAINGTAMAPALVVRGGDWLTVGVLGWPGILVLALLNGALYWFKTRKECHCTATSPHYAYDAN